MKRILTAARMAALTMFVVVLLGGCAATPEPGDTSSYAGAAGMEKPTAGNYPEIDQMHANMRRGGIWGQLGLLGKAEAIRRDGDQVLRDCYAIHGYGTGEAAACVMKIMNPLGGPTP